MKSTEYKVELTNETRAGRAVGTLFGVAEYVDGCRRGYALSPQTDEGKARAVAFFLRNAGYSYDPKKETESEGRVRCACALADAETYAHTHGWRYEWKDDPDGASSLGDIDPADVSEILYCVLYDDDGKLLGSLGGITFGHDSLANRRQGRVFEASLAFEALAGGRADYS